MIPDLKSGQLLASHYRLDKKIQSSEFSELWVATQTQTGERACLRVLPDDVPNEVLSQIERRIESVRGLLHEHISLARELCTEEGIHFLVEPFIPDAKVLDLSAENAWRFLNQLIETVRYSHSLGISHGHLKPGNLLLDTRQNLMVTGFNTPDKYSITSANREPSGYESPQLLKDQADQSPALLPEASDDIYALGCLLFRCVSGQSWNTSHTQISDAKLATPLTHGFSSLLDQMLSHSSFHRNIDLVEVGNALTHHYSPGDQGIAAVSFSRTTPSTPVTVSPSEFHEVSPTARQDKGLPMPFVLSAAAVLLVFAGLLFLFLPGGETATTVPAPIAASLRSQQDTIPSKDVAPVKPGGLTPVELARIELMEEQSQSLAKEILRQQLDLEDAGVNLWADEAYVATTVQLEAADNAYRDGIFDDALNQYRAVKASLNDLAASAPVVLSEQISRGDDALADGDVETALTAFTIATLLEPENEVLVAQLERAENLETVLRLTQQAEILERNAELKASLNIIEEAIALDGLWRPAIDAKQRLRTSIRQQNFRSAMSRGFRGISERDYVAARKGFKAAKSIMPGSDEPEDGLSQVEQSEKNDTIQALRTKAEQQMFDEAWSNAIATFEEALAVTNTLDFAIAGKAIAERRRTRQETIAQFLSDPTLLQSDEALAKAASALRDASRSQNQSETLTVNLNTLALLISSARTEIPVTLKSDGQTEVTVRKHAELGRFESETVYLIPGRYIVVGERPGFRDVRENLVILPGHTIPTVTISSTEKVRR
ncbi:MAG: serine/threonine protein kinase [Candidatus Azotimanducaceae bacterium]|jgi:serine/threonine protein kinase